jgi:hypothetical protein
MNKTEQLKEIRGKLEKQLAEQKAYMIKLWSTKSSIKILKEKCYR